jgi:putative transposase
MNRAHFATGEWYHCYTRGVEKRKTFLDKADYRRFLELLYLCNNQDVVHRSNLKKGNNIFEIERQPIVDIAAFCLMPNHFHILVSQTGEGGLTRFMRKLNTGYTMYFNKRYERIGNLFVKPFRSKHIEDDNYARQVFAYIHLNPLDLENKDWYKNSDIYSQEVTKKFLLSYEYSSLANYLSDDRETPNKSILSSGALELYSSYKNLKTIDGLLEHARDFIKVTP